MMILITWWWESFPYMIEPSWWTHHKATFSLRPSFTPLLFGVLSKVLLKCNSLQLQALLVIVTEHFFFSFGLAINWAWPIGYHRLIKQIIEGHCTWKVLVTYRTSTAKPRVAMKSLIPACPDWPQWPLIKYSTALLLWSSWCWYQ